VKMSSGSFCTCKRGRRVMREGEGSCPSLLDLGWGAHAIQCLVGAA
jgi:hypothetical protein